MTNPDRSHEPADARFHLQKMPDEQIEALRQVNLMWFDRAAALAHDLNLALDFEIQRRFWNAENGDEPPMESELFALRFDRWSDADFADALVLTTQASYNAVDVILGDLMDALVALIVQAAADRLRQSGDERNAVPYAARTITDAHKLFTKGLRHDAETN